MIGLCSSCGKRDKMLSYFVNAALQAAGASENVSPIQREQHHVYEIFFRVLHSLCRLCVCQATPQTQCSFCIFLVKTLEDLLPKERTEVSHTQTRCSEATHVHMNKHSVFLSCTQTFECLQTTVLAVQTPHMLSCYCYFTSCGQLHATMNEPDLSTSHCKYTYVPAPRLWQPV